MVELPQAVMQEILINHFVRTYVPRQSCSHRKAVILLELASAHRIRHAQELIYHLIAQTLLVVYPLRYLLEKTHFYHLLVPLETLNMGKVLRKHHLDYLMFS